LDALPEENIVRESTPGWGRTRVDAFRNSGRIQQYGAFLERIAFLLDAGILYCTLYLSVRLDGFAWTLRSVTLALLSIVIFNLVTSFRSLYRTWRLESLPKELVDLSVLVTLSFLILAAVVAIMTDWGRGDVFLQMLIRWWALSLIGISGGRLALRLALRVWRAGPREHRRVAFYGTGDTAAYLAQVFRQHPWMGLDIVGFFDDMPASPGGGADLPVSGGLKDLVRMAREHAVSAVYITMRMTSEARVKEILDQFGDTTVSLHYCPSFTDLDMLGGRWDDVFGVPVISVVTSPFDELRRHLKRLEDLVLVALILPIIALPVIAIALAVRCTSPGPALYFQSRHGLSGRPFKIWKFRTMYTMDSDSQFVQAKADDTRVTPLGSFLRRTSLDELPQIINVLLGEMSFVGPRPAPLKYNEDHRGIIYRYMLRHKVKPGITGLAQVNGCRGETESLEKTARRTAYDLEYIDNWSLWLDLKIVASTAGQLIRDFVGR
jgi:putative colanic acid biosynthesis UDP-glucose lipid carrier transferase